MAGENTVTTLTGLFKKRFADKLLDIIPEFAIVQALVTFDQSHRTGEYYEQPVVLASESGFTYNGPGGGVTTLNGAANGVIKPAQLYGSELILQSRVSYKALSQGAAGGEQSYMKTAAVLLEDMHKSMRKRVEIAMIYGQVGIGTVSTVTDLTGTAELVLTDATWAGGIWSGSIGHRLDAFNGTTKRNTNGVLTITKIDADLKKITVSYTTAIQVLAGDVLYYQGANAGASSFNEMAGLQKIITNTGTLFGIDASVYDLWKGNTVASVGELTHGGLQAALSKAVNKGLMEKVTVLLSPRTWAKLNTDQASLRQFDSSYSKSKLSNGTEALEFHSQNGLMQIVSHPMVKDGDCFIVPMDSVVRTGSTDVTFQIPGVDGEKFFRMVENTNAVEFQCMCDQGIMVTEPGHCVYLSGIVNS